MMGMYIADVGDGLCAAVCTVGWHVVQIDCGSQQGSEVAFEGLNRIYCGFVGAFGPAAFVLSHFHVDHYNGLLYASASRRLGLQIRRVYYPRLPEFKRKEEFFRAMLAMNCRVFGSETGVMEYDLLKAISRVTDGPFVYSPLSKGSVVNVGSSAYEVLWPPRGVEEGRTLTAIERALQDFDEAIAEDEEIRELHHRVIEEGLFGSYLEDEGGERAPDSGSTSVLDPGYEPRELPGVVKKASQSLRAAANHLSLAFFEDNRLLFLGDTEGSEIRQIIADLKGRHRRYFYALVTPHHGTHWHSGLKEIRCVYSINSVGRRLCSRLKSSFREIAEKSIATWVSGDIRVPALASGPLWRRAPW
jgi:hypothetical protein